MEKELKLSDEWRILRNAISVYYKKIKNNISSVIYSEVGKMYKEIYSETQIEKLQQAKTANSISVVYNSIYKKFFCINDINSLFGNPKWQNKLSCNDLTRLILLLNESLQIVKKDRGDYTYIEARIDEIPSEDFLSLNYVENNRGFKRSTPLSKNEIESKENLKKVFEKYLEKIYGTYKRENVYVGKSLKEFQQNINNFISGNSIERNARKKSENEKKFIEEKKEIIGFDYSGRNVVKLTRYNGNVVYLVDGEENSLSDIKFTEEENENPLDIEKIIKNNSQSDSNDSEPKKDCVQIENDKKEKGINNSQVKKSQDDCGQLELF